MFAPCPTCRRWRDTEKQQSGCPHPLKSEFRMQQRSPAELAAARSFVGKQVWFSPDRRRPHMVQGCSHTGMLTLEGVLGEIAPHWCVLA
jgi:hypothetical protein